MPVFIVMHRGVYSGVTSGHVFRLLSRLVIDLQQIVAIVSLSVSIAMYCLIQVCVSCPLTELCGESYAFSFMYLLRCIWHLKNRF